MKDIKIYKAPKYAGSEYNEVAENIYKTIEKQMEGHRAFREATAEEKKFFKENTSLINRIFGWSKGEGSFYTIDVKDKVFSKSEYTKNKLMIEDDEEKYIFVTTLSFIQEPEYGEGENASMISQYPLEDVLDEFFCYVSDFYQDINKENSNVCYVEFASSSKEHIEKLLTIAGKHVYNKDEGERVILVVE